MKENLAIGPAGYPLLMWPILELFRSQFFAVLAILQSALYLFGAAWLVDELRKTRLAKASYLVAIFLAFNPTLALNTISVGYELPVVALKLISFAAFLRYVQRRKVLNLKIEVFIASVSFASNFYATKINCLSNHFFPLFWG